MDGGGGSDRDGEVWKANTLKIALQLVYLVTNNSNVKSMIEFKAI